jgi:hypothetical protein
MQRYKFSRCALGLIIFAFIALIQIIEQMLISFSCSQLTVVNNEAKTIKPELALAVEAHSFNLFDSSMNCDSINGNFASWEIYASIGFMLLWLLVVPQFVLFRAGREYIIDYIGITTKFLLLVVIKYVLHVSEFYAMVCGSFVVVL